MRSIVLIVLLLFFSSSNAQESLEVLLQKNNTRNIPYISVHELEILKSEALILDAREDKEYDISHINNAIHIGFKDFSINNFINEFTDTNKLIVVYCSLGLRSEVVADEIKKAGYKKVFNLFGGIFEWKNNEFPVYNSEGLETEKVHAFSKKWGKWLSKGEKIYD